MQKQKFKSIFSWYIYFRMNDLGGGGGQKIKEAEFFVQSNHGGPIQLKKNDEWEYKSHFFSMDDMCSIISRVLNGV